MKEKGKERRKSSPEKKKERLKAENGSLLKELGTFSLCVYICVCICVCVDESSVSKLIKCTLLAEHMLLSVCLCVHVEEQNIAAVMYHHWEGYSKNVF